MTSILHVAKIAIRYILAGRYYLNENTGCLVDSLLPIFHLCEYRTVDPTFSDVVLKNTFYHCNAVEALVMWYR